LSHFALAVDLKHRRLIDTTTKHGTVGIVTSVSLVGISMTIPSLPFADILKDYPSLANPFQFSKQVQHTFKHHVVTTGQTKYGLQLKVTKFIFGVRSLDFMGLHDELHLIKKILEKVQSVLSLMAPKTLTQLPIEYSLLAYSVFVAARKALAEVSMLQHLNSDASFHLILTSNASNSTVNAVLHQQVQPQFTSI
uniref:WS_DGAT_C domain-containing protein n=1 Tax=Schistocephalus solidus TaxID=70667 RepID=A0A183SX45_SCHSO